MKLHYKNIFIKLLIIIIVLIIIGLPINTPFKYYTLLLCIPIIIFGEIYLRKKIVNILFFSILVFVFFKFFAPTASIQEGHNVVLLNKNSSIFYKKNLPLEIYDFFDNEFKKHYSDSQCDETLSRCWKNFNPLQVNPLSSPTNKIFAVSSDWSFNKIKYSRIVDNINISNLISTKIGAINNLAFNFFWLDDSDIGRMNIPYFVMFEIPKELKNSSICWKGNLFWESNNHTFLKKLNTKFECKKISNTDIGKKFYGTSMGDKNKLILKLKKSVQLKIVEIFYYFSIFFFIICLLNYIFKYNYKLYLFSLLNTIGFILIVFYVNKNLFLGFDIFTGGNDGLLYMSYGNVIFSHLINLNFYEFFRGVESVFYFPSSLRYFWSLNKVLFGESFFGYLAIGFLYPLVLYFIFKYLFGNIWSIILTIIVSFTRLFEGYALSVINMLQHINAGDAEPFAIFFLLLSILIFLKFSNNEIKINAKFYNFLFGFLLFLSVSLRPNFLPTALVFIIGITFYNCFYNKKIIPSFFILIGFLPILLIPFHNYYYGNAYVLLSSGHHHNTNAPLSLYYSVFQDLINFQLNEDIIQLKNQFIRWIQPTEIHYILTFIVLLILLIKKNNFPIKMLCILALSQHFVLLIFEPTNRYAYLAWMLTIILNMYFIRKNLIQSKLRIKIKKLMFK